jgi:hypothetical protein
MVSAVFASSMALSMILFGMHAITQNPLNISEWAERSIESNAPTMAVYFAYETMAGAFLHLAGLGIIMGMLSGMIGGMVGKAMKVTQKEWYKRANGVRR